jgi:NACHT domain
MWSVVAISFVSLTRIQDGPMPRYSRSARFDQGFRRATCAEGTRVEILRAIHRWFKGDAHGTEGTFSTASNSQAQIFWLDGVAGTGKSTIAQTIAEHYHGTKELGASFFCSRDDSDCSNITLIVPSIAYQIASGNPTFKRHLSEAMRKDPTVQSSLPSRQLEKLVIEPMHAVMREETFPPYLVIIDALDECKDTNTTSIILSTLVMFPTGLAPLKLFVTSRPVSAVVQRFHNTGLMKDTNKLVLHSITLS